MAIVGKLESLDVDGISGWVADDSDNFSSDLLLYFDGKLISTAKANLLIQGSPNHHPVRRGFRFPMTDLDVRISDLKHSSPGSAPLRIEAGNSKTELDIDPNIVVIF